VPRKVTLASTRIELSASHWETVVTLGSLGVVVDAGVHARAAGEGRLELHVDRGSVGGQTHGRASAGERTDVHRIGSARRCADVEIVSGHSTAAGRPCEGRRCASQRAAIRWAGDRAGGGRRRRPCQSVDQAASIGTTPASGQIVTACCRVAVAPTGDVVKICGVARACTNRIEAWINEAQQPVAVCHRLLIDKSHVACPHGRSKARAA